MPDNLETKVRKLLKYGNTKFGQSATNMRNLLDNITAGAGGDVVKGLADGSLTEFVASQYGVTTLAARRFSGFTNLTKLDLRGITNIPEYTANDCSNLTELILDNNITEVGQYAFQNLTKITPFNIIANNLIVNNYAFDAAKIDVLIGTLSKIGDYAFRNTDLKILDVTINGQIGSNGFSNNKNLTNLNINKDSNITSLGQYAFSQCSINVRQNNPEYWDLDFKNSTFTSIAAYCFQGSSSNKIKNIKFQFSNKVTTLNNYAFAYSDGFRIYWNSIPTLSATSSFQAATNYKNFFPYQLAHTAKTSTNWSSTTYNIVDSIYGYAEAGTFTLNEVLPTTDNDGYALTWYSDEDLTQEVQTVTDVDATYYCIVSDRTHVKLSITQFQADVIVSDGTTTYNNGDLVPVGSNLTITAVGQGANTEKYMFELNNVDITSGHTYIVGAVDMTIICIYWDGINLPVNSNFADNTPQQIKIAIDNGLHRILWNVGDTKTITLTNNTSATIRLTDTLANRYEKTDGTGYSNGVLEFTSITSKAKMNTASTNLGGWPSSEMNTLTMTDTLALLPQEWQDIISEVKVGSATSGNDSTIVYANNKCFLASGEEIFGTANLGSYYYTNETIGQFEYYVGKSASNRIKQFEGTNTTWWLRSPHVGYSTIFVYVNTNGSITSNSAHYSGGVSACFAI